MKSVLVVGQPRSGTSLTVGFLRILGVELGYINDEVFDWHPTGILENEDAMRINSAMMVESGGDLFEPPTKIKCRPEDRQRIKDYIKKNKHPMWGFKDPRLCYTLKFWYKYLPDPHVVFVRRKKESLIEATLRYAPKSVTKKQVVKNIKRYHQEMKQWKNIKHIFVDFDKLRNEPLKQAEKIAKFLGVKMTTYQKELIQKLVVKK